MDVKTKVNNVGVKYWECNVGKTTYTVTGERHFYKLERRNLHKVEKVQTTFYPKELFIAIMRDMFITSAVTAITEYANKIGKK